MTLPFLVPKNRQGAVVFVFCGEPYKEGKEVSMPLDVLVTRELSASASNAMSHTNSSLTSALHHLLSR